MKLRNHWLFNVFHQSHGVERLLSLCLKSLTALSSEEEQTWMDTLSDGKRCEALSLRFEVLLRTLDMMHCLLKNNRNNNAVFMTPQPSFLDVRLFVAMSSACCVLRRSNCIAR